MLEDAAKVPYQMYKFLFILLIRTISGLYAILQWCVAAYAILKRLTLLVADRLYVKCYSFSIAAYSNAEELFDFIH